MVLDDTFQEAVSVIANESEQVATWPSTRANQIAEAFCAA